MTCFLKRALPFMLTLIIGIGLGSLFGFHGWTTGNEFRWERRHHYHRSDCYREKLMHDVATPLDITFQPNVRYTPEALKRQTTGVVQLRVSFNADGTATVLDKLSTLPDGLTDEAVRVAEHTEFTPEKVDGTPVTVVREMNYIFTLYDSMTMQTR